MPLSSAFLRTALATLLSLAAAATIVTCQPATAAAQAATPPLVQMAAA